MKYRNIRISFGKIPSWADGPRPPVRPGRHPDPASKSAATTPDRFPAGCGRTGLAGRVGRRLDPASPASGRSGPARPTDACTGPPAIGESVRRSAARRMAHESCRAAGRGGATRGAGLVAGAMSAGRTGRRGARPAGRSVRPGRTPSGADPVPAAGRNRGRSLAGRSGKPVRAVPADRTAGTAGRVRRPARRAPVPPRSRRSRAPPSGSPRPAPAGPAARRRRTASGRRRWRPPR